MGQYHNHASVAMAASLARRALPHSLCGKCGLRLRDKDRGRREGHHIVPMAANSPVAVVHRVCNRGDNGIIPDSTEIRRMIWLEGVVRSASSQRISDWLADYTEKVYGDRCWTGIAMANTGRAKLRRRTSRGLIEDRTAMLVAEQAKMRL